MEGETPRTGRTNSSAVYQQGQPDADLKRLEKMVGTWTLTGEATGGADAGALECAGSIRRTSSQTPFENLPSADPLREHRLYQASFLMRDYGWKVEDLTFLADGVNDRA